MPDTTPIYSAIHKPVERHHAPSYLLIMLVAFAFTVTATRAFLALTGYPQLGNSVFHIAHAVWGGLLLFVGGILPLILANRWMYFAAAIINGVGFGLFIDEIGKFITQTNDYFFPLAAPLVYASFLLVVVLYLNLRRPRERDARSEMYRVLEELKEVLDHDCDPVEKERLLNRLDFILQQPDRPDLSALAQHIQQFMLSDAVEIVPSKATVFERLMTSMRGFDERWLRPNRFRYLLMVAFAIAALGGVVNLVTAFALITSNERLIEFSTELFQVEELVTGVTSLVWYIVRMGLDAVVGLMFALAILQFLRRNDRTATWLGRTALIISLSVVNLLTFYFDQFWAIAAATAQVILLLLVEYYRQSYLPPKTDV